MEYARDRVAVHPAVTNVASQGRRPATGDVAQLDYRRRGEAVLERRRDQLAGAPHGQQEERSLGGAVVAVAVLVVGGSNCLRRQPGSLCPLRRRAQAVEDAEQQVAHVSEVGILVHGPLGAAAAPDLNAHLGSRIPTFRLALHPIIDVTAPL